MLRYPAPSPSWRWIALAVCLLGCNNVQPTLSQRSGDEASELTNTEQQAEPEGAQLLAGESESAGEETASNTRPAVDSAAAKQPGEPNALSNQASNLEPTTSRGDGSPNEFRDRLMAKVGIGPAKTATPDELINHLQTIDLAIRELMTASANNAVDEREFRESGISLGQQKLSSAERLSEHPEADQDQSRSGLLAKLVALSHLSGFRNVEAAKELESFASELSTSDDPELAHQSRVVLLGFQLQALQNGQTKEPDALLASIEGLFTRPSDRGFPELMSLLQATQVLDQMGFNEAARRIESVIVQEFRQADDRRLRAEAWNIETRGSQALENFATAFGSLGTPAFDRPAAFVAARGLLEAFPSIQTLEQLAGTITNIEYSGNVQLAQDMAELIKQGLEQFPTADGSGREMIQAILAGSEARLSTIGQPLMLDELVDFEGKPFQWSDYEGKVVLVDFWATWCMPCLKEIPELRRVHGLLGDKGFAVLSVNMDENLKEAKDFVLQRNFPWKTYHAADTSKLGFKSVIAERYGIAAIPFMVLIGPDGNVVDVHVRGDRLFASVQQLLGQPASLIPADE